MNSMNADDVTLVNCADCGRVMLGDRFRGMPQGVRDLVLPKPYRDVPSIAGRINDRPYCVTCLRVSSAGVSGICGGHSGPNDDDIGSYRTIAVRAMEDSP